MTRCNRIWNKTASVSTTEAFIILNVIFDITQFIHRGHLYCSGDKMEVLDMIQMFLPKFGVKKKHINDILFI